VGRETPDDFKILECPLERGHPVFQVFPKSAQLPGWILRTSDKWLRNDFFPGFRCLNPEYLLQAAGRLPLAGALLRRKAQTTSPEQFAH
jgi:hypothetical protein